MATPMNKMKQRGSRRKQPEEGSMEFFEVPSGFEFSKPPSSSTKRRSYAPPPSTGPASVPRQPTASEAALSAKNIRFAKELSDLRVRHREECQKSARLTMENMSLASRCREAISHVAILQRELMMYQQRDCEALALQRRQTQRIASNLSERMQFDINDRDALPIPPKKSVSPMPVSLSQPRIIEQTTTSSTSPESRLSSSTAGSSAMELAVSSSDEDTLENSREESFQSSFVSTSTSPDVSHNDSNSSYVLTPSPNSQYSTPNKRDTPLHTSPTRHDVNSPMQHLRLSNSTSPARIPVSPTKSPGRRDVFEASFATTFPRNFDDSPGAEDESQSSTKADVYDPFSSFSSPNATATVVKHTQLGHTQRGPSPDLHQVLTKTPSNDKLERPSIAAMVSWEDDDVSSPSSFSTPPRRRPEDESDGDGAPKPPVKTPSAEVRAKYDNAMRVPSTPPRCRSGDESSEDEPPKPPLKTPSAEARSKYEVAMQPRAATPFHAEQRGHRPSPLLQRIQQKRKQKQLNRQQSEPSSILPKPDFRRYSSAPESRTVADGSPQTNAENRDDRSLVNEETTPQIASSVPSSRRRGVKQPVSYAEPALNTKIRKGHVFFQKDDVNQHHL
ncbi:unnamed protein product [Cylindrotheca closterium]|uniref:Shugoshin C-terminal domain-containing protein n=1 Tax=Cylindrotheca closterium TaxID=2856 RepID=A0AAD2G5Q6_9STRA|nr:unnamed protein product [Cylindrotheca closterium]